MVAESDPIKQKIHILLFETQPKVRFALIVLLGKQEDMKIIGVAATSEEAKILAAEYKPDVALISIENSGEFELIKYLKENSLAERIILLGLSSKKYLQAEALKLGADAFIEMVTGADELLTIIRNEASRVNKTIKTETHIGDKYI
jgi:DNA-binding NarL/FixJ family response regulator